MTLGMILLAAFLIVYGLLAVTNVTFAFAPVILGLLAIAAGVLLLLKK